MLRLALRLYILIEFGIPHFAEHSPLQFGTDMLRMML